MRTTLMVAVMRETDFEDAVVKSAMMSASLVESWMVVAKKDELLAVGILRPWSLIIKESEGYRSWNFCDRR